MGFEELKEQVAHEVWRIECAEQMIPVEVADQRWERLSETGSGLKPQILWLVGCTLIALKKLGLIEYEGGEAS